MKQSVQWKVEGEPKSTTILKLSQFDEKAVGFIYELHFSNGRKYIGRKALSHKRTRPPLKGAKRKRVDYVDSGWLKYEGSIKNLQYKEDIKAGRIHLIQKVILKICFDKWDMTYYETKYQFDRDCLVDNKYYNGNILGKFYRKKLKK